MERVFLLQEQIIGSDIHYPISYLMLKTSMKPYRNFDCIIFEILWSSLTTDLLWTVFPWMSWNTFIPNSIPTSLVSSPRSSFNSYVLYIDTISLWWALPCLQERLVFVKAAQHENPQAGKETKGKQGMKKVHFLVHVSNTLSILNVHQWRRYLHNKASFSSKIWWISKYSWSPLVLFLEWVKE